MPKLLIICDVYPPSFAPRMGYLVKYMKEWNWEADIVTRSQDKDISFKSLLGDEKVIRVKGIFIPMKTTKDKVSRLISLKKTHKKNAKLISNEILNTLNANDYQLILCSTAHRTFVLDAAYQVAKTWNKPWVADIRDLYEQKPTIKTSTGIIDSIIGVFNGYFMKFMLKERNKRLANANATITISPWHVKQLKKYNTNTHLIYNGFCPEHFFSRPNKPQKTFKVTYTGIIGTKKYQDSTFFFLAVRKLVENGYIDDIHFRIQFYTPVNWRKSILENPAYIEVKEFVDFFDYVDTSKVPQLLNESAVLLLLTNVFKPEGPKGIMPTKYFEYLAMERPILCVRSDENLLETSIKKANAGIAAKSVEETYDFLLEKWKEWNQKGYTTINVDRGYTQQFSRKLQAKQFVDLFHQVIDK